MIQCTFLASRSATTGSGLNRRFDLQLRATLFHRLVGCRKKRDSNIERMTYFWLFGSKQANH
jgi:hypothetical protein